MSCKVLYTFFYFLKRIYFGDAKLWNLELRNLKELIIRFFRLKVEFLSKCIYIRCENLQASVLFFYILLIPQLSSNLEKLLACNFKISMNCKELILSVLWNLPQKYLIFPTKTNFVCLVVFVEWRRFFFSREFSCPCKMAAAGCVVINGFVGGLYLSLLGARIHQSLTHRARTKLFCSHCFFPFAGEYELCKAEEEALGFDPDVSSVLPAFDSFSLEEALKIAGLDQPKVFLKINFISPSGCAQALF